MAKGATGERLVSTPGDGLSRTVDRHRTKRRLGSRLPLFCTFEGRALKSSSVRTLLARLAMKAGIEKTRVHPHGLRHTLSYELAMEAVPSAII